MAPTDGETHVNTADVMTRASKTCDPLDRLLQDEMNRLLDRLAGSVPAGSAATLSEDDAELAARIADEESRLSDLRSSLIDGYRRWSESMQSLEDLWALRALKTERPGRRSDRQPDRRAALAAERRAA